MEAEAEPGLLEGAEIPGYPTPTPQTYVSDWFTCEEANSQSIIPHVVTLFKFWLVVSHFWDL